MSSSLARRACMSARLAAKSTTQATTAASHTIFEGADFGAMEQAGSRPILSSIERGGFRSI